MELPKIKEGIAGKMAKIFLESKLTPIVVIVSLLFGIMAVVLTPKEEEPQITVPMIDVMVGAPGFEATEVERKVTEPIERALWGIDGVEYIYSASRPHGALITVRFKVNEAIEPSLVKIHHKMMAIKNELPQNVQTPSIKSFSIDDVPFLAITFSSNTISDYDLRQMVAPLARELSSTPDLSNIELIGGPRRVVRVIADAQKMAMHKVTMDEVYASIARNHMLMPSGKNWSESKVMDVEVGGKLKSINDVMALPLGNRFGRMIKISDVAKVVDGPEERTHVLQIFDKNKKREGQNAVTLSFAKRKGTNVVDLAQILLQRIDVFKNKLPKDIDITVIRNYGETANEKSHELIEHLLIATFSVALLMALAMGMRAALVVAVAIPVTLSLTLAIYYFMGYTLNRVTLFALIFSIGILVDDAIVVVENIERYLKTYKGLSLKEATLRAVSEVGNPTILATFTVIAAILPMAFVRGLMGPYMKPIPVGASVAMIFSLFVAFTITPWASNKLLKHENEHDDKTSTNVEKISKLDKAYLWLIEHLLTSKKWALGFIALVFVLFVSAMGFFATKAVKVKMLPFDNKSEFQITLDFPQTTPLEKTNVLTQELVAELLKHKDVEKIQTFVGTAAPFSFSGMVKHTFMRQSEELSDLQVVLKHKSERDLSGHEIINQLRPVIDAFSKKYQVVSKVLEIPPGPPVMATMLAEVYGPDRQSRAKAAQNVYDIFKNEPSITDLDISTRENRPRYFYEFNYENASRLGPSVAQAAMRAPLLFNETKIVSLDDENAPEEVMVTLAFENEARSSLNPFSGQIFGSIESGPVASSDLIKAPIEKTTQTLYRKNLRPVEYVFAELQGEEEAPVYGILKLESKMPYPTQTAQVPWNSNETVVKWDGEWFITYEVFRDLGAAFLVVMILIYILVVGWFKSFLVPLVIMAPIPISLIGIVPGHYLTGAYFTATSMIGFIAGAGVIVRNSIILVDFIEHQMINGYNAKEAVISAGILRFRPMLLTAAAVVVGSIVMLFDPIFQGLAVSLIFGEIAATLLSRFAVPLFYYWALADRRLKEITGHE